MSRWSLFLVLASVFGWASAVAFALPLNAQQQTPEEPPSTQNLSEPTTRWQVNDPEIRESSGVAADPQRAGRFWTHNDSGDSPRLFTIDLQEAQATTHRVVIDGADSVDWEDMATGVWDGEPWIVVGDVGDNASRRDHVSIYLMRQPDANVKRLQAACVTFRYDDGPRNCEAVVMGEKAGEVFLISKVRLPFAGIYRLQIPDARWEAIRSAAAVASDGVSPNEVSSATDTQANNIESEPLIARRFGTLPLPMITAADRSADGKTMAVTTYLDLFLFRREDGQTWGEALSKTPEHIPLPRLKQIEAVAFDAAGQLWVTSEGRPMPLVKVQITK